VKVVKNVNPIQPGNEYSQAQLLDFKNKLQATGYFLSVEITADHRNPQPGDGKLYAPVKVVVIEHPEIRVGLGAGFSTNTGARIQTTLTDLNFLQDGWRLTSSLRLEQLSQNLLADIRLPTTRQGYRDSINSNVIRTDIEGQTTTSGLFGVRRAWGLPSLSNMWAATCWQNT